MVIIMKKRKTSMVGLVFAFSLLCGACGKESQAAAGEEHQAASDGETGNLMKDGGFEGVDLSAWIVTNVGDVTEELELYDRATDAAEGVQSFHFYSSGSTEFSIEQTVDNLEAGAYRLSCQLQGDGANEPEIYLYAVIDGETYQAEAALEGYLKWNTPELTGLSVENGSITVGMSVKNGPGGWGSIDDFILEKE